MFDSGGRLTGTAYLADPTEWLFVPMTMAYLATKRVSISTPQMCTICSFQVRPLHWHWFYYGLNVCASPKFVC